MPPICMYRAFSASVLGSQSEIGLNWGSSKEMSEVVRGVYKSLCALKVRSRPKTVRRLCCNDCAGFRFMVFMLICFLGAGLDDVVGVDGMCCTVTLVAVFCCWWWLWVDIGGGGAVRVLPEGKVVMEGIMLVLPFEEVERSCRSIGVGC